MRKNLLRSEANKRTGIKETKKRRFENAFRTFDEI